MEGKTPFGALIMGVLILSLLLAQTQVEAKSCCKNTTGRLCYNACRSASGSQKFCARRCSCIHVEKPPCPPGYPSIGLESSADTIYQDYCKLGCASTMCNSFSDLQNSGPVVGEEVFNADAVEQCTNACSAFCTKGSTIAVESA